MANALMPIPILNNYKTISYRASKTSTYAYCSITLPEDINNTLVITNTSTGVKKILRFVEYTDAVTGELLKLEHVEMNFTKQLSIPMHTPIYHQPIHIRVAIAQKLKADGTLDKPQSETSIQAWINENSNYVSHWSNTQVTVFSDGVQPTPNLQIINTDVLQLTDNMENGATDTISSAIFTVKYNNTTILTSPRIYATNNSIAWRPNITGYDGKTLTSIATYTTNLGTVGTCSTDFSVPEPVVNSNIRVTVTPSIVDGALQISATNASAVPANPIYLERKQQENNDAWERLYTKTSSSSALTYKDYAYDSSHSYQYRVYREKDLASSGAGISSIVYAPLEDMRLMNNQGSLVIKFNPQLTGMKYSVTDAILNPLGAQYPIVRRNGAQNYRTFTLGGLISYETETSANALSLLNTANIQSLTFASVADEQYYKERIFRERVLQFLYDDTVKLLRTPSEGNMLVRLTNVSLTPNQQLGNMLYTFSATCTEVAAPTEDNYKKYDVIPPQ